MPQKVTTPAEASGGGGGLSFTAAEVEALRILLGFVRDYDVVRAPYPGEIQSVLAKLSMIDKDSPEMSSQAASLRAPVRMQ